MNIRQLLCHTYVCYLYTEPDISLTWANTTIPLISSLLAMSCINLAKGRKAPNGPFCCMILTYIVGALKSGLPRSLPNADQEYMAISLLQLP